MQPKVMVCTECETGAHVVNNTQFSHNYAPVEIDGNFVNYETTAYWKDSCYENDAKWIGHLKE